MSADKRGPNRFASSLLFLWVLALSGCQSMMDANAGAASQPAPADTVPETRYYQLILSSQAGETPHAPEIRQIRVQHVNARSLGELISRLYLPAGPSGTRERYVLIYPSIQEWNAAIEAVKELDIANNHANFDAAISGYLAVQSNQTDAGAWRSVLEQLQRVAGEANESVWQKWAAGMMAGAIAMERLDKPALAAQIYELAEGRAAPGSLEQMNAMYRRARALLQSGRNTDGRRLLTQIVGQFATFRNSEAFDRARQMLADMDRGR